MTKALMLMLRQVTAGEQELKRAPLPCRNVITALLDYLDTLPTSTTDYGDIMRTGSAVCSARMFYSHGRSSVSCRLKDMAVDAYTNTLL